MSIYDILMLAIFLGSVLFGAWKGLAWQVASLVAVVASYFVAINFSEQVAAYLQAEPPWNKFGAMLILFLGTSLIIWMIFGRIKESIKKMHLGGFDRQAGALVGAVKGALLCMIASMFGVTLLGESTAQAICNSRSGGYITRGINHLTTVVPDEIHGVLEPYVARYNNALENEHEGHQHGPFPNQPDFTQAAGTQSGRPIYGGQTQQNYGNQNQQTYGQFTPIQNPNANQNYQTYNGQWQQNPQVNSGYNGQQQQYGSQNQGYQNPNGQYGGQNYGPNQAAPQYGNQGNGNLQQPSYGNSGYSQYGGTQQQQSQQPAAGSGWPKIEIDSQDLLKAGTEALKESAQRFIENQNR